MTALVTLLSDFGARDGYVGAMKGVLLDRCPSARLVDISHAIPPGDVDAGAYVLEQAARFFPAGTIHLAVVDPGVGSGRRAVVVEATAHRFVAPDNGLLTLAIDASREGVRAHAIENARLWREEVSDVFHGRDVFAPIAAFLACGGEIAEVGARIDPRTLVRRRWPEPRGEGREREGAIVYVDGFGNLVTNLPADPSELAGGRVEVAGQSFPVRRSYSDVASGALVAVRGSAGLLEVACRGGSAAQRLGVGVGAVVTWRVGRGS
jgi:hypothetical protein